MARTSVPNLAFNCNDLKSNQKLVFQDHTKSLNFRHQQSTCTNSQDSKSLCKAYALNEAQYESIEQQQCRFIQILQPLGQSNYQIYSAKHCKTGRKFALKIFKDSMLRNEAQIVKGLNHQRLLKYKWSEEIVKLYKNAASTCQKAKENQIQVSIILMELVPNGNLLQYLYHSYFSEDAVRFLFKQLVVGVNYLHLNGISHRDLKLENLLLDENFQLIIADFGQSSFTGCKFHQGRVGTINYMAPQIIENKKYCPQKADVFALGLILFKMLTGLVPFEKTDETSSYQMYTYYFKNSNKDEQFWEEVDEKLQKLERPKVSKGAQVLIQTLLSYNQRQRLFTCQILQDPWLQQDLPIKSVKAEMEKIKGKLRDPIQSQLKPQSQSFEGYIMEMSPQFGQTIIE